MTLARQGWKVIGTGRNAERMGQVQAEISAIAGDVDFTILAADLSSMADTLKLAHKIISLTDRLDLLINNAGAMTADLVMTSEGLEANFAGNHLGPFLLTQELLRLLKQTARDQAYGAVRILNTTSDASEMISSLDLDDLQGLTKFDPGRAYCTGKLANVIFARALADRLDADGIVAHAVHPGAVDSNFFSHASPETRERLKHLDKLTEAEGADTLIWLATAPEGDQSNGDYWHKRARRQPNPTVEDRAVRDRLWVESERLIKAGLRRPDCV